jgi:ubiquitin carboxyl-terminal hydrolase 10
VEDTKEPEAAETVETEQTSSMEALPASSEPSIENATPAPPPPKAWSQPKAWGGVFNKAGPSVSTASSDNGSKVAAPTTGQSNSESLAEALRTFSAEANDAKVTFLEPRGLVNTGNMCYMNSVSIIRPALATASDIF